MLTKPDLCKRQQEWPKTRLLELAEVGIDTQGRHGHSQRKIIELIDHPHGRMWQEVEGVEADNQQKTNGKPGESSPPGPTPITLKFGFPTAGTLQY